MIENGHREVTKATITILGAIVGGTIGLLLTKLSVRVKKN